MKLVATLIALVVFLIVPSRPAAAGDGGQLVRLLADYAGLKERVQEIRAARKAGHASDSMMLMELFGDIVEARQAAFQFRAAQHTTGTMNKTDETTSTMIYAYEAMSQMVAAEVDRNLYLPESDISLRMADRYEEIWKLVDAAIPAVSVTS
ncbi:MAG TPA: hypothetical protein VFS39_11535 [Nitrospira sp.]|nr:hypothetical protein [Nitrospira sp.]